MRETINKRLDIFELINKVKVVTLLLFLILILSFPRTLQNIKFTLSIFLFTIFLVEFKIKKYFLLNISLLFLTYLIPFIISIIYKNEYNYIIDAIRLYVFLPILVYSILQLYDLNVIIKSVYYSSIISIFIIVFITLSTVLNAIGFFPYNFNLMFYPDEDNIGLNTGYLHIINSQLSYLLFLIPVVFYKNINFKLNNFKFLAFLLLMIFCFFTGRRILMLPFVLIFILNLNKIITLTLSIFLAFSIVFYFNIFEIDLLIIWDRFLDAISSRGDSEARGEQIIYFMDYIKSKPLFGYGIGSYMKNYLRNYEYKTAYEITYLYYLFSFGFIGTLIVCSYYIYLFRSVISKNLINLNFKSSSLILGILTLILASITNPYWLSSFDYCLPLGILMRMSDFKYKNTTI